ncbi:hypothetical protein [Halobellus salinisoli]|uniref:hypothetical protein n=1 Tax=Halobellus salinisoli TaxID=3108500 RepID=UPI00300A86A6
MIGDSFWTPKRPVRIALLGAVLAMVVLHQSELLGLMNSQALVFGWIPVQIAYDVAFLLVGTAILAVMYVLAPEPPAEHEATIDGDATSTDSSTVGNGGE